MEKRILLKVKTTEGAPDAASLLPQEPVINTAENAIYYKDRDGVVKKIVGGDGGGTDVDWEAIVNKPGNLATTESVEEDIDAALETPQFALPEFAATGGTVTDDVTGVAVPVAKFTTAAFKVLIEAYFASLPGDGQYLGKTLEWIDGAAPQQQLSAPVLSAGAVGIITTELSTTEVPNATIYVIERSTDAGFSSPSVAYSGPYSSEAIEIAGLAPNTGYYFREKVKASGYLDSDWSNVVNVTTQDGVVGQLDAPTLTINTPNSSGAAVTLTAVANAENYIIEVSQSSSFDDPMQVYSGAGLTPTIGGLESGTLYYGRPKAQASGYTDSEFGDTVSFMTAVPQSGLIDGFTEFIDSMPLSTAASPNEAEGHVFTLSPEEVTYTGKKLNGIGTMVAFKLSDNVKAKIYSGASAPNETDLESLNNDIMLYMDGNDIMYNNGGAEDTLATIDALNDFVGFERVAVGSGSAFEIIHIEGATGIKNNLFQYTYWSTSSGFVCFESESASQNATVTLLQHKDAQTVNPA